MTAPPPAQDGPPARALSARPPRVLCTGRLYCDLIFTGVPRLPSMGTEVFAQGVSLHAGGGAAITAAHLAHLGQPAALAAHLPPPPFHDTIARALATAGVDTRFSLRLPASAEPQITVAIAGADDRAFLTRRSGDAAPPLDAADLTRAGITHLHIGELATLVACPGLTAIARGAGATVSLDCGWDEALGIPEIEAALRDIDVFLPNASEMRHLSGLGLCPPFAPLTVVKRGAEGATARTGSRDIHIPARPARAIDTTGAGDAFNAGFLVAWLAGAPIEACLDAGNRQGALAVATQGGFPPAVRQPHDALP